MGSGDIRITYSFVKPFTSRFENETLMRQPQSQHAGQKATKGHLKSS